MFGGKPAALTLEVKQGERIYIRAGLITQGVWAFQSYSPHYDLITDCRTIIGETFKAKPTIAEKPGWIESPAKSMVVHEFELPACKEPVPSQPPTEPPKEDQ